MRIGGLFEGYGGLTMAARAVFGGELAWVSEYEPPSKATPRPTQAAARLLAHHHPNVPNLGDITAVDWPNVEPVDVLCGGFPCQDVSSAGKQAGLRPDSRSGLWAHFARAVNVLRPSVVIIENVRGLLSAEAACDLEPCPWCLGDRRERPLRALGAVLGDLAVLGYDAQWTCVGADAVGAPHQRARVFVLAWPAASDPAELGRRPARWDDGLRATGLVADAAGDPSLRGRDHAPAARSSQHHEPARSPRGPGGDAADTTSDRRYERWPRADLNRGRPVTAEGGCATADTDCDGLALVGEGAESHPRDDVDGCGASSAWGDYAPAIARWERVLGRPAPPPTMTGARGGQQLSPLFVEWLMGLPEGWVTDVPGLTRNEQLKLLGNGVVPQQAERALRALLAQVVVSEAAA